MPVGGPTCFVARLLRGDGFRTAFDRFPRALDREAFS